MYPWVALDQEAGGTGMDLEVTGCGGSTSLLHSEARDLVGSLPPGLHLPKDI